MRGIPGYLNGKARGNRCSPQKPLSPWVLCTALSSNSFSPLFKAMPGIESRANTTNQREI